MKARQQGRKEVEKYSLGHYITQETKLWIIFLKEA